MRRVLNLQRDPVSNDLFAIGKRGRPYTMAEVRALIDGGDAGDPVAAAGLIDVDLGLDRDGARLSPEVLALAKRRARLAGWPPRAAAYQRKRAWERDQALRRSWRSVPTWQGRRATPVPIRSATPVPIRSATPVPIRSATPVPIRSATPATIRSATPATISATTATGSPAPDPAPPLAPSVAGTQRIHSARIEPPQAPWPAATDHGDGGSLDV